MTSEQAAAQRQVEAGELEKLRYWRVGKRALANEGGWAGFADLGASIGGRVLVARRYSHAERSCIRVLRLASGFAGADKFEIKGLRVDPEAFVAAMDFGRIPGEIPYMGSGFPVELSGLRSVARLILRGGIWCVLKHPHLEVHFPGGCAMVIGTDLEFGRVLRRIERRGFSVEPVDRPTYEWEIGD